MKKLMNNVRKTLEPFLLSYYYADFYTCACMFLSAVEPLTWGHPLRNYICSYLSDIFFFLMMFNAIALNKLDRDDFLLNVLQLKRFYICGLVVCLLGLLVSYFRHPEAMFPWAALAALFAAMVFMPLNIVVEDNLSVTRSKYGYYLPCD